MLSNTYYFVGSDDDEYNKIKLIEFKFDNEPSIIIHKTYSSKIPKQTHPLLIGFNLQYLVLLTNLEIHVYNMLKDEKEDLDHQVGEYFQSCIPLQIVYISNSKKFLIRFSDNIVRVYDPTKEMNLKLFWTQFETKVKCIAETPDHNFIILGKYDGTLAICDSRRIDNVITNCDNGPISNLIATESHHVISFSDNFSFKILDLEKLEIIYTSDQFANFPI